MPRGLIIEGKPVTIVANPVDAFEKAHPSGWTHRRRTCRNVGGHIRRSQGIACEVIFHIGQQQFLMLLFMVQTELDNRRPALELLAMQIFQKGGHMLVHVGSITIHLLDGWT